MFLVAPTPYHLGRMSVYRTLKYAVYPTARQARDLDELFGFQSEIYNAALEERREAFKKGISITKFDQFCQLRYLHQSRPEVMRFGVTAARGTLTRLDRAFQGFFRRAKAGQKSGYPRFRSRSRFDTVSFEDITGWRLAEGGRRLYLQGVGYLKLKLHRPITGIPKTLHVRREGKKLYALIQCEAAQKEPLPKTGRVAGFDLGINHLVAASDGSMHANPRHFREAKERLAARQQELARKKKGAGRRRRAVGRVAACHRKVRNQRKDYLHKLSKSLIASYDLLVFEDLNIANMSRSAKGTLESPGTNVAQKAGLNREVLSASWGQLLLMLAYKAEDAGRELILVDPRGTSQRCSGCAYTDPENRVSTSEFKCQRCGHGEHADVNAAKNILRLGLSQRLEKREAETCAS